MTTTVERLPSETLTPPTCPTAPWFLAELGIIPPTPQEAEVVDYGDLETAAERLVRHHPNSSTAYARLARDQLEMGDAAAAVASAQRAIELGRDNDYPAFAVALGVLISAGGSAEAANHLQSWFDSLPADQWSPSLYLLMAAELKARRGEVESALEILDRAVPDDPIAAGARASLLLYTRRYDAALHQLRVAIDNGPATVHAYTNLGFVLGLRGSIRKAIRATQVASSLAPRDKRANLNLANFYLVQNDVRRALDVLEHLAVYHPHDHDVVAARAGVLMRAGNLAAALSALSAALASGQMPSGETSDGAALRALKQIVRYRMHRIDARGLLSRLFEIFEMSQPASTSVALSIASLIHDQRYLAQLRDVLNRIQRVGSQNVIGVAIQVAVLEGRLDDASRWSRQWLSEEPFNSTAAVSATYLVGMAEGHLREAVRIGEAVMRRVPSDSVLSNNVAFAKILLGDRSGAERCLVRDSSTPFPTSTAALLALSGGDIEAADALYKRAMELADDDPVLVALIGLYRQVGYHWFERGREPDFASIPPTLLSDARILVLVHAWTRWMRDRRPID